MQKNIIIELAKQELIQKPHIMARSWVNNCKYFKDEEDFQLIQNITKFYEKLLAIPKRIIGLIEAKSSNESEKDSLGYLKQYITGLYQSLLKIFLSLFQDQT